MLTDEGHSGKRAPEAAALPRGRTGAMAAGAGRFAPMAFIACAIAMAPVVICLAEGGRRVPTSGGAFAYIDAAFGSTVGFVAGTLLSVGCVLSCGAMSAPWPCTE